MGLFDNLKKETKDVERSEDRVGGGFQVLPSDIYTMTVRGLFEVPTSSGARRFDLIGQLSDGKEYKESFFITTKEGKPYYISKQDSAKKIFLPGFEIVDDICMITTEKPLADQQSEEKVFNVFNGEMGKEVPTSVPTLVDVVGKQVALGIVHEIRNKQAYQDGKYVDTDEQQNRNVTQKVFHPEYKLTVNEARKGAEAEFWDKWLKSYKTGKPVDRRKIKEKAPAPKPENQAPRKSLFGNK